MNTADRSIARIDTAMRRRFAFVELDPRIPPVQGLLAPVARLSIIFRTDAALLLDELNRRLEDSDAAIGPSYLMKQRIYRATTAWTGSGSTRSCRCLKTCSTASATWPSTTGWRACARRSLRAAPPEP